MVQAFDWNEEERSKEQVLVIDDEPYILLLISRYLERAGYEVETAHDGLIALEQLRETPFAMILSDLKMPRMDGLQVLEVVREQYPDTVFVLMTGFATLDSAVSVLRKGAYDYLIKPLDLDDLLTTVQRALEHRRLLQRNKRLTHFLQEQNVILEELHRQERHKAEQLNRVNEIIRQITPILDVETLTTTVVDLVRPVFQFASLSFGLIVPDPEESRDALVFRGGDLEGTRQRAQDSVFWQLTDGGRKPFARQGMEANSAQEPYDLIFPLRAGAQVLGFWVAHLEDGALFQEADLPHLASVAAQTVVVLQNARLYALARRADELAFLNEIGRVANRSLNLEQTIGSVLLGVRTVFGAAVVELCLLDSQGKAQQVFSLLGGQGTFEQSPVTMLEDRLLGRVEEAPLIVREPHEVRQFCMPRADGLSLGSLMGVALRFGERPVGVLVVGSAAPGAYDREDGRLLQVVGGHVATAIQNARLFQEVVQGRQVILKSRDTLQTLFDGILEGICIIDREHKVLAINRTQAKWAGLQFSELVGHPAERAFPMSQSALTLITETFLAEEPMSSTDRRRTEDGRWTEWEIHTYPIANSAARVQRSGQADWEKGESLDRLGSEGEGFSGLPVPADGAQRGEQHVAHAVDAIDNSQVERVIVVVRDVTEERWLEASLIQSEKLAAVGRLAAGVAHEINNPLTVILANTQILREEIATTHPYYGSIELISRASERTSRVVRNLLDFARAEQFEFVLTDLNRSLEEAVSLVGSQVRKANIEIVTELSPGLPPIWASPDHLHVVWLNLLLNARDAIVEADREGTIRVSSHCDGDRVVVHVTDNGVGMPLHMLGRIFDPFFTTKPPGKGTGLGLFTCYRTVERHGGEINVDSQVDVGTSFEICLPIRQEALTPE